MSRKTTPGTAHCFTRWMLPGMLLAWGIWIWLELIPAIERPMLPTVLVGIMACVCAIPAFNRCFEVYTIKLKRLLSEHPRGAFRAVTAGSAIMLLAHAWEAREFLFPKWHDEHVYMTQARMLAKGLLWRKAYPADVSPFFDSFYLITDRVYAAMYFPGTALVLVPTVWLGLPGWIMPMVLCIGVVALVFAIASDLFGPRRAVIAAIALVSVSGFRFVSITILSEAPFLFAQLTLWWAWMRWRRRRSVGWAWLIGAAAGFAAITRPIDAICFVVPVCVAIIWDHRHQITALKSVSWRIAAAILPFLALQVIQNVGISGKWNVVPESYYVAGHYPAPPLGFHGVDSGFLKQPATPIQHEFLKWIVMFYRGHRWSEISVWGPRRISEMLLLGLAGPLLAILLPLAIPSIRETKRAVIAASLGLFVIAYLANVFNLTLYMAPAIVPIIFMLLMAWETLDRAAGPNRRFLNSFMTTSLIVLCMVSSARNRREPVDLAIYREQQRVAGIIASIRQPSVVLFGFDPHVESFENDPVYNDDVAWPDEARVIRAHDLGDVKNQDLYTYYDQREPDRVIYRYDPLADLDGNDPLARLGTAHELAR